MEFPKKFRRRIWACGAWQMTLKTTQFLAHRALLLFFTYPIQRVHSPCDFSLFLKLKWNLKNDATFRSCVRHFIKIPGSPWQFSSEWFQKLLSKRREHDRIGEYVHEMTILKQMSVKGSSNKTCFFTETRNFPMPPRIIQPQSKIYYSHCWITPKIQKSPFSAETTETIHILRIIYIFFFLPEIFEIFN